MTTDTITHIALDNLFESLTNPRRHFSGIEDLAANIKAEGRIHSPLLVRPMTIDMVRQTVHVDTWEEGRYEIVFGHRRFRAAEQLGLATVPCMVRAMSDAEVLSAQLTENIQRENMSALEEGQGFRRQIDEGGATADEIAARIGKSRSYVYGRMRLLGLCREVRQAYDAGEVDAEVALLVARVGSEKLQQKALGYIKGKALSLKDGGKQSYRRVRDLLNERFTLRLDKALFDPTDEMLLPDVGYCGRCPKRTGNAPEFTDVVQSEKPGPYSHMTHGPDVCTDPDCFDAKKRAHLRNQAARLEAAGQTVVDGHKARQAIGADGKVKGGYIALADVKAAIKATAGVKKPEIVTIQDPRDGKTVKAYKVEDLKAAGVKVKTPPVSDQAARQERQHQKEVEQKVQAAKAQAESDRRFELLLHVRAMAATRERSAFELRMVASQALHSVGYHDVKTLLRLHDVKSKVELEKRIDALAPAALTALLLDCLIVDAVACESYNMHQKPGPLLALASHYGINPKAVIQASAPVAEGTPTPPTAARAAKNANGQAKGKATKTSKASSAAADDEMNDEAGCAGEDAAETAGLFDEADA